MPDWLLQSLASRIVWEILLILGVGAILGYLKKKWPEYASSALYGLLAMMCVAVLLFTFTGSAILSKQQPETTPENVEANIRAWADDFHLTVKKDPTPNGLYFMLEITTVNGYKISVVRLKDKAADHYLEFATRTLPSPEQQIFISRLSKDQATRMIRELVFELAKTKNSFGLLAQPPIYQGVQLTREVPITSGLNQEMFSTTLDEIQYSILIIQQELALQTGHN